MNSREKILSKINNIPVDVKFQSIDVVDFIKDEPSDLVEEYIMRATENKAFVQRSENLIADINAIIAKEGVNNLIYPTNLPINVSEINSSIKFAFDKQIEEFKPDLFNYDIIVLLKKENIVKSLSGCLNEIKAEDSRLPTNILFICGPSRTSDIELVPVLGVHGSQIVYILVY